MASYSLSYQPVTRKPSRCGRSRPGILFFALSSVARPLARFALFRGQTTACSSRTNRDDESPTIYDALTGKRLCQTAERIYRLKLPNSRLSWRALPRCLSAAVQRNQSIDARNGAVVGDLFIPDLEQESINCEAFGFSSDGSQLRALRAIWKLSLDRLESHRRVIAVNLKLDRLAAVHVQESGTAEKVPAFLDVPAANGILLERFAVAGRKNRCS